MKLARRGGAAALLTTVAVAGVPLVAGPAYAASTVICVGSPAGSCDQTAGSIQAAISAAAGVDATILVGPGTYTDGPYELVGSGHTLTLEGAGQGSTILTLPASASPDVYVNLDHASVRDLTVKMAPDQSAFDEAISVVNGGVDHVTVDGTGGAGTSNATGVVATGATVTDSVVQMPVASGGGNTAVSSKGGDVVVDTTLDGYLGLVLSAPGLVDTVSRVMIRASYAGLQTDSGTIDVDDTLIDLGTNNGIGLAALNFNADSTPRTINADHVTIVGGATFSWGVFVYAANPDVVQHSAVTLTNSIVRGPAKDLVVQAGNKGGLGASSTATITTSYSDWHSTSETSGANGEAHVVSGPGHVDVDPAFVSAAGGDYRLSPGSALVDHGDPAGAGPALDLAGGSRVVDGNGDGTAVRDLGAYELPATSASGAVGPDTTAPDTRFGRTPGRRVARARVRFGFTSTEASTFQCRLDRHPWRACTSPKRVRVDVGRHRFSVRARDLAGNTDPTPATYRFRRVR